MEEGCGERGFLWEKAKGKRGRGWGEGVGRTGVFLFGKDAREIGWVCGRIGKLRRRQRDEQ